MKLYQAFRVQPKDVIAFVGGGGKTTALFRLADELVTQEYRVIISTTTHLGLDQVVGHGLLLRYSGSPDFVVRVRDALKTLPQLIIVGENVDDERVKGVPPTLIDELAALDLVDAVVYEADGARRLPFKAPAEHEPVVALSTTLLVPTLGINALGAPLDDEHVHRAEITASLVGVRCGETITPSMAARVITNPEGGLKHKPSPARVVALVNQVETNSQLQAARTMARFILESAEVDAVVIGAVRGIQDPIREAQRRIAAVVLAAGSSTRMSGHVKQLLSWRGKTLIENAIDIAVQSQATETIVVLGAYAEEIRNVINRAAVRIVTNLEWETGHASSIRAGLSALSPKIEACIFINADQPLLTVDVLNAIIQRYRETDASIIVPLFAGQRGSPVLFARKYFIDLGNLRGEQGGRVLLNKYPIEHVEFSDRELGIDVDTWEEYEKLT